MKNEAFVKQERTSGMQLFPYPQNMDIVEENPPCFSWIPADGKEVYNVTVYYNNEIYWSAKTDKNYIIPDKFFDEGMYSWNIRINGYERGLSNFIISSSAVKIKRVTGEELYNKIPDIHPRHLFYKEDIGKLLEKRTIEIKVLKRNIELAYKDGLPSPPKFHLDSNALPCREYFGRLRDYCDRNMVACALGYALLSDERAGEHAKNIMLTLCEWNPYGPSSMFSSTWCDEIGCSIIRTLPAVYDLIYPLLEPMHRECVERTIYSYGIQCYENLKNIDFCVNPGYSHASRTPAYMGEAAMVLKGSKFVDENTLIVWLTYAMDIYGGVFPFYGTTDGGWAEGVFYSTSYTKWYLPFLCAVERYSGCNLLDRPFYQRLTQFFLHFANPEYEIHPFGDGYWCHPEDKEWPGFFAQNPCRYYAERFGPEEAEKRAAIDANQDVYLLHLLDIFIPSPSPPVRLLNGKLKNCHAFTESGFVSMHTDIRNVKNDTALLVRASKFGSVSHQHADQGSFALFHGGTALISPTGYYGRMYGTKHHIEWTNSTFAHNTLVIDGKGQEMFSHKPVGKILECIDNGDTKTTVLELTNAYTRLKSWKRTFVLGKRYIEVTDDLSSEKPCVITYQLHTLSRPYIENDDIVVLRDGKKLVISVAEGEFTDVKISDKYKVDLNEGVPEEFHVSMPEQFHIEYQTLKETHHKIKMRLDILV